MSYRYSYKWYTYTDIQIYIAYRYDNKPPILVILVLERSKGMVRHLYKVTVYMQPKLSNINNNNYFRLFYLRLVIIIKKKKELLSCVLFKFYKTHSKQSEFLIALKLKPFYNYIIIINL